MGKDKLISKKEVLEKMGISYGQLYRWKRKGLIPEAWFVRRSTFTGQETFFPEDQILERIRRIKEMKSEHALDDLAGLISEQVAAGLQVAFSQLRKLGWLDDRLLRICEIEREDDVVSMNDTFCLAVLRRIRERAREEELALVRRSLLDALDKNLLDRISNAPLHLYLVRKRVSGSAISAEISMVIISPEGAIFDPDSEEVVSVDLGAVVQRVKLDLAAMRGKNGCVTGDPEEER